MKTHEIKKPITQKYNALFRVGIVVGIIIILIIVSTILSNPRVRGTPQVCFKHDNCLGMVGIMDTSALRQMGLQGRPPLKENEGMLFVFPEAQQTSFWMKDMTFPIDIIWLDKTKRILKIEKNVPACKEDPCPIYPCNYMAKYVVETPAGFSEKANLYARDQVVLENIKY